MDDVAIINADFIDLGVLRSENVQRADVIITASSMDERNLLACMAALRFGTRKIISKYSNQEYEEIFRYTGIESIIGYQRIIYNEVVKSLIFDESAILAIDRDNEYFFSVTIDDRSALLGNSIGDINMPDGIRIAAIQRGEDMIYPKMDTVFHENDKVLLFTHMVNPVKLSRLFGHYTPVEL